MTFWGKTNEPSKTGILYRDSEMKGITKLLLEEILVQCMVPSGGEADCKRHQTTRSKELDPGNRGEARKAADNESDLDEDNNRYMERASH